MPCGIYAGQVAENGEDMKPLYEFKISKWRPHIPEVSVLNISIHK